MNRQVQHPDDESQVAVQKELKDDLVGLYGTDVSIPPARNEAILSMAREHMARRRRLRLILRRSLQVASAAAVMALAVLLIRPNPRSNAPSAPLRIAQNEPKLGGLNEPELTAPNELKLAETAHPKDIDHNGRVDILDAFVLARRIESRADALVGPKKKQDRFVFQPTDPGGQPTTANGASQKTNLSRFSGDVNGDGVIDNGDVDAVAMAAVRLKGGAL